VFDHIDPLLGSAQDLRFRTKGMPSDNDMDLLHSETLAGAHDGGGVLRIEEIFEYGSNVSGSMSEDLLEALHSAGPSGTGQCVYGSARLVHDLFRPFEDCVSRSGPGMR
jgi:hypothetical protein